MSDDSAVDSTIDLKKRARRRLVGAAALALLAVIVLPVVMDSEPKPTGQDIQIHIPSQDTEILAPAAIPDEPAPMPEVREAIKPAPAAEAPGPKAKEMVEKSAAPPPVTTVSDKKNDNVRKSEAERALAVLEGRDSEQWVVQLGAYQNVANVKQLTNKLKELGLPSYTERIELPQGPRTRVRAGPFDSKETADRARVSIKTIGVDGPVAKKE